MDTFIQSHLHDYHSCTSLPISTAGYLLEESRLITFAQGQRVSSVWASNLLVTSPFSLSNRSYGSLKSSAQCFPSPLKWPLYHWKPSNTVMRKLYCWIPVFRSVYPAVVRTTVNNVTSLMDLQVGWRFTKGRHVSEIRETTVSEGGMLGLCQMSPVLPLQHGHAFVSHLAVYLLFSHILLKRYLLKVQWIISLCWQFLNGPKGICNVQAIRRLLSTKL